MRIRGGWTDNAHSIFYLTLQESYNISKIYKLQIKCILWLQFYSIFSLRITIFHCFPPIRPCPIFQQFTPLFNKWIWFLVETKINNRFTENSFESPWKMSSTSFDAKKVDAHFDPQMRGQMNTNSFTNTNPMFCFFPLVFCLPICLLY